ncbi:MAG: hypothetical protein IJ111_05815 [Eggerthellaceae bacterium]|nr:hypothetical protein [Eggerthellaceae bacterium]
MITEKDMEQYLDEPVRVKLADGKTFDGVYWDWQLEAAEEIPEAMLFNPLDGRDLQGGHVIIPTAEIEAVRPLSA